MIGIRLFRQGGSPDQAGVAILVQPSQADEARLNAVNAGTFIALIENRVSGCIGQRYFRPVDRGSSAAVRQSHSELQRALQPVQLALQIFCSIFDALPAHRISTTVLADQLMTSPI